MTSKSRSIPDPSALLKNKTKTKRWFISNQKGNSLLEKKNHYADGKGTGVNLFGPQRDKKYFTQATQIITFWADNQSQIFTSQPS